MKHLVLFLSHLFLLIQLIGFLPKNANSQSGDLLRGEIDARSFDFMYFIPMEDGKLITIQHLDKPNKSKHNWQINQYSSSFKLIRNQSFETPSGYKVLDYFDDHDSLLHFFFGNSTSTNQFIYLKYNYLNSHLTRSITNSNPRVDYEFFQVLDQNQFIAGVKNPSVAASFGQFLYYFTIYPMVTGSKVYSVPPVISYRNASGQVNDFLMNIKGESHILTARANTEKGIFAMLIRNRHKKKTTYIYVELDKNGKQLIRQTIDGLEDKTLLTAQFVPVNDAKFLLIGTYNNQPSGKSNRSDIAEGIFVSKIWSDISPAFRFHAFTDFQNIKDVLDFRVRKKYESSKRQGNPIDLGFKILVHDEVLQFDSSYVILAERYNPEYHYETYYNIYGSMYNEQVFDGYRFTDAIAAAFTSNGDLLWDNTFSINDIISYNLEENVVVYFDNKTQVLLYYFEGKIYSKVISGSELVFEKEETEVETVDPSEKILHENYGKIYHWYDSYFLLTGYQVVIDSRGERRKVFFFVKLKFG
ncbi:MAG: hypothetical protein JXR34_10310 [Bacteroidales bacterium]|nr:hypothetical protein [Bacteroidales bacterium]